MARGMVNPEAAARGCGDVKDGFEHRYVLRGFACCLYISLCYTLMRIDPHAKLFTVYARTHA